MKLQPFERCEGLNISADVKHQGDILEFRYFIEGDTADIAIPSPAPPTRTDGLWRATCFEAFIIVGKTSYIELNFAPSGRWAAYRFTNYRQGMRQLDIEPPTICFTENRLIAKVELIAKVGSPLNLAAIIKRTNGNISYWAISHSKGDRPDFHARDCFVANLP